MRFVSDQGRLQQIMARKPDDFYGFTKIERGTRITLTYNDRLLRNRYVKVTEENNGLLTFKQLGWIETIKEFVKRIFGQIENVFSSTVWKNYLMGRVQPLNNANNANNPVTDIANNVNEVAKQVPSFMQSNPYVNEDAYTYSSAATEKTNVAPLPDLVVDHEKCVTDILAA